MATGLNRRTALSAAAVAGVGAPLLVSCAADESPSSDGGTENTSGDVLAKTSDIAVGACTVYPDAKVVVTQPTEGEFKCFTAVCTHQGCLVSSGSDGVIPCNCHGSQFSLEDGSPQAGPATTALAAVEIVVDGDNIALA
ncbi:MAG: Rieske (2Fe-2S) protein [Nocardioides sp.]|nr:Rieske (2Fe-2S) protein [Nocardioides sp.]